MPMRGPRGASNKKKSQLTNRQRVTNQRGHSASRQRPRPPAGQNGKAEGTNNNAASDNLEKQKRNRCSRSQQKKKPTSSDWNRSRQPSKTKYSNNSLLLLTQKRHSYIMPPPTLPTLPLGTTFHDLLT